MAATSSLTIVAAVAQNGVIGHRGQLPWRLSADLKHFKALTLGHIVVMGRKTFESLPGGPLAGRCNVILSRGEASPGWRATLQAWRSGKEAGHETSVVRCNSLEALLGVQQLPQTAEWFVIGGQQIYELFLPYATHLSMTDIALQPEGDAFFPAWDRDAFFETLRQHHPANKETPAYDFVNYRRQNHLSF